MYHLHITSGANPTLYNEQLTRRTHLLKQPLPLLKRRARRTRHNRQRPIRCTPRTPGNRRIDEENIAPANIAQLLLHTLDIRARNRRAQNQRRALRQCLHDAVGAKERGLRLWRRRDHDDVEGLVFCGVGERVGWSAACGGEFLEGRRVDVEAGDGVALLDEVGGHAHAHGAEAAEADGGFGGHGLCGGVWWVIGVFEVW